jgi:ABC-type cobalamin/Fe3+-siderophores transport system ATPase subunit
MLRARQQATGLTLVWATHDLALAERFSDATLDLDRERSPGERPAARLAPVRRDEVSAP